MKLVCCLDGVPSAANIWTWPKIDCERITSSGLSVSLVSTTQTELPADDCKSFSRVIFSISVCPILKDLDWNQGQKDLIRTSVISITSKLLVHSQRSVDKNILLAVLHWSWRGLRWTFIMSFTGLLWHNGHHKMRRTVEERNVKEWGRQKSIFQSIYMTQAGFYSYC